MILHFDLSTGASGDKLLGALLELCETLELITFDDMAQKARRLLPGVVVERETAVQSGIAASHITVREHDEDGIDSSAQGHAHATHRHWKEIRELINDAAACGIITENTAKLAVRAFTRVAKAEAQVHNTTPERVHFHEVGAADSIIDIVFNSLLLDLLAPTTVYATPLALGSGTVMCEHGELPVPAPATAEILAACDGLPVYASSHAGELTTPTGAALIAEFVTSFAPLPCSYPRALGYGAGSRTLLGAANVLRVIATEPASLAGLTARESEQLFVEGITQLECNLDHLSAEAIAFAAEELLAAGALDVWQESITMKKGRFATKLVVLASTEQATEFAEKIIALTGSLGVRSSYCERTVVPREVVVLDTPYGPMPFKAAALGAPESRQHWLRPEHDAVARLARERNLNYGELSEELQEWAKSTTP